MSPHCLYILCRLLLFNVLAISEALLSQPQPGNTMGRSILWLHR